MSYNAKNYTEQGGDVTHIGGKLVFDGDNGGGLLQNMSTEAVQSDSVAKVRTTLNSLITQLKNAGLMVGDAFSMTVTKDVTDSVAGHADRSYNTGKISSVEESDGVIVITLSEKVADLKDFDGGNGWGVHKWLGIGINAGISPITGLKYNGTLLTIWIMYWDPQKMKKEFGLADHLEPVALLIVGYKADHAVPRPGHMIRKSRDEILI